MKKILLIMAVAVAMSLTGCDSGTSSKSKGEQLSKQLDEQVEKKDTAAAIASDEMIRKVEAEITATGDSVAIAQFREAMKDSRVRNAAFVTVSKIHNGMDKNKALEELMDDALDQDINMHAVTSAINAILMAEDSKQPKTKKAKK